MCRHVHPPIIPTPSQAVTDKGHDRTLATNDLNYRKSPQIDTRCEGIPGPYPPGRQCRGKTTNPGGFAGDPGGFAGDPGRRYCKKPDPDWRAIRICAQA